MFDDDAMPCPESRLGKTQEVLSRSAQLAVCNPFWTALPHMLTHGRPEGS